MTDTLVTPYGNINLDSLFGNINVANPLDPGDALTGLQAGDSAIGADAFTIGGTHLRPDADGRWSRRLHPGRADSSVHRRCWTWVAERRPSSASR